MVPGDGKTNDTAALLKAVAELTAAGKPGVLAIEPGTYVLTAQINVSAPIVLRGAGIDTTTLFFPQSLSEVVHCNPANQCTAYWCLAHMTHSDGFRTICVPLSPTSADGQDSCSC